MREQNPPLVPVLLVLALFGFVALPGLKSSRTSDEEAAKAGGAGETSSSSTSADFLKPLRDFFTTVRTEDKKDDGAGNPWPDWLGRANSAKLSAKKPNTSVEVLRAVNEHGYKIKFLVATVPDPAVSQFGYLFDAMVDAIQRAVEKQESAVLDRFWYPWQAAKKKAGAKAEDGSPIYSRQPGLLLFRSTRREHNNKQLAVVFLVGETPTAGIHKEAMAASLDVIKQALDVGAAWTSSPGKRTVKILGPTFSGAAPSLHLALLDWGRKKTAKDNEASMLRIIAGSALGLGVFANTSGSVALELEIISGSAVAIDKGKLLKYLAPSWENPTFQTTVLPDEIVLDEVLGYLKKKAGGRLKIAVLTEANTAFGNKVNKNIKDKNEKKKLGDKVLVLPFPLHVAEVQAAVRKNQENKEPTVPRLKTSSSKIPLPLKASGHGGDTEPSLDPAMTAAMEEQVLSRILTTISQENIQYVGIISTDPRDKIFLAGLIRDYFPDVQLFTTSGDQLLAHPDYSYYMKGTIVGTSYPLFSPNQRWSFPFHGDEHRLLFGSQTDIGTYNAAVLLLGENEDSYENLLEYGMPFSRDKSHHPPVWICVVGRNGLWPLQARNVRAEEFPAEFHDYVFTVHDAANTPGNALPVPGLPLLWISAAIAVSIVCAALCVAAFKWHRKAEAPPPDPEGAVPAGQPPAEEASAFLGSLRKVMGAAKRVAVATWTTDSGFLGSLWKVMRGPPGKVAATEPDFYLLSCLAAVGVLLCYIAKLDILSLVYAEWSWSMLLPCITLAIFLGVFAVLGGRLWSLGRRLGCLLPLGISIVTLAVAVLLALCPQAMVVSCLIVVLLAVVVLITRERWALLSIVSLLAPITAALTVVLVLIQHFFWEGGSHLPLELMRATNLSSGVAPFVAVSGLTIVLILWGYTQLKRRGLQSGFGMGNPLPSGESSLFTSIQKADQSLRAALNSPLVEMRSRYWFWVGGGVLVVGLIRIGSHFVPSIESRAFDCLFLAGFGLAVILVAFTIMHFLLLWSLARKLLRQLVRLPMVKAYDRLPPKIAALFGRYLNFIRPRLSQLTIPVHQVGLLAEAFPAAQEDLTRHCGQPTIDQLKTLLMPARGPETVAAIYQLESQNTNDFARVAGKTQDRLEQVSRLCAKILECFWNRLAVEDAYGTDPAKEAGKEEKKKKDDEVYPLPQPALPGAASVAREALHQGICFSSSTSPPSRGGRCGTRSSWNS